MNLLVIKNIDLVVMTCYLISVSED